jgi:hypothetical protein
MGGVMATRDDLLIVVETRHRCAERRHDQLHLLKRGTRRRCQVLDVDQDQMPSSFAEGPCVRHMGHYTVYM